ncbi:unnamed protein product [Moneuplotes crassus]|uniref:Uncharacterized protein n=1 Tax=Euplotes crassus TaxID=5936 RepID=A0AAD2D8Q1_EUPCR|nr:unnamed protein product [Moneuplotes crassus]
MSFEQFCDDYDQMHPPLCKTNPEDTQNSLIASSNCFSTTTEIELDSLKHLTTSLKAYVVTQDGHTRKEEYKVLKENPHELLRAKAPKTAAKLLEEPIDVMMARIIQKKELKEAAKQQKNIENVSKERPLDDLWISKYKPKKFYELLTDELTNRNILTWLSSWNLTNKAKDNSSSLFGDVNPITKKTFKGFENHRRQFKTREYQYPTIIDPEDLDYKDQRILIIGGDPGMGKTVLAETLAAHAGFNVENLDANGSYTHDELTERILFSTQNRSLFNYGKNKNNKPTCLIVDGVDPDIYTGRTIIHLLEKYFNTGSIKYEHKYKGIQESSEGGSQESLEGLGTHKIVKTKVERSAKKVTTEVKRPIILICRNIYSRSLNNIKKIGITFKIRKPESKKMLNRLTEIGYKEGIHIESSLLKKLIIESNHDITSCLNILKYTSSGLEPEKVKRHFSEKPQDLKVIKEAHLFNSTGGFKFKKDMLSSVFDCWDKIFKVKSKYDKKLSMKQIQKTIQECDRPIKFFEGLYWNYLSHNYYDEFMDKAATVLESFVDYNRVDSFTKINQNYQLMGGNYLPAAFCHHLLSHTNTIKNEYPKIFNELYISMSEIKSAIREMKRVNQSGEVTKEYDVQLDYLKKENDLALKYINSKQILREIIPYLPFIYRNANLVKNSVLNELDYKILTEISKMIKIFPLEIVRKISLDGTMTRSEKLGLKTKSSQSLFQTSTTSALAYQLRMKLKEAGKVYASKSNGTQKPKNPSSSTLKENHSKASNFSFLDSKRKRVDMEAESTGSKFIFKYKEGYINAVRRPVPFEFFL